MWGLLGSGVGDVVVVVVVVGGGVVVVVVVVVEVLPPLLTAKGVLPSPKRFLNSALNISTVFVSKLVNLISFTLFGLVAKKSRAVWNKICAQSSFGKLKIPLEIAKPSLNKNAVP